MDLDQLKSNWEKSKTLIKENYNLNKKEMEAIIKKQSDTTTQRLSRLFVFGIVVQSMTVLFQIINLISHISDINFTLVIAGTLFIVVPALLYSINRYKALKSADFQSYSLAESLKQKIEFYKFSHNKWLLGFALSFVVFLWSINMIIGDITSLGDVSLKLILLYAGCFILIYFSYRNAHTRYLKEYEICLNDLGGKQLTDLQKEGRNFRLFKMILIAILLLTLIVGVVFLFLR
jgi:hypothetical protein